MIQCVGTIGPKVSLVRFACPGSELLHRQFVCMQHRPSQKQRLQSFPKWGEVESGAADPVTES